MSAGGGIVRKSSVEAEGFLAGVGDVWRGWAFLTARPRLWVWAAIPFVLNTLFFAGIVWFGWSFFNELIERWAGTVAYSFLGAALVWIARILFWIAAVLIVFFAFTPLASLIAAPFNDLLSEKVEMIYAGAGVEIPFSFSHLMRGLSVGLKTGLWLASKTLILVVLTFPVYFVPVIGAPVAAFLQACITIRFLALQHTSYSMDRRLYDRRRRSAFLRDNRGRTIGMGAMSFAMMTLPVVNALFIPVSAVAGTLLFCDAELRTGKK